MYLILAWRNIWRNKRRSLITIGSITFAVLLACVMRSMQLGSYERMIENAARFYTGYIQIHENGYWDDKTIDNSFEFKKTFDVTIAVDGSFSVSSPIGSEEFPFGLGALNATQKRDNFVLVLNQGGTTNNLTGNISVFTANVQVNGDGTAFTT